MKKPNSRHERQTEATRFSNHYILTCTNETCKYLKTTTTTDKPDTETKGKEKKEYTILHDSDRLYKAVLKYSEAAYPLNESEQWKLPPMDVSIFHTGREYEATLKTKIPTQLLDKLAEQAEEYICKANNVKTNTKHRNYYFYQYLIAYHNHATQNHKINLFNKEQAIQLLTEQLIDTHFLAHIITYYNTILNKTPTYKTITEFYKTSAVPEAERILKEKFNINFKPVEIIDSLFLETKQTPPFQ